VAVLSSGFLTGKQSLQILDSLRNSALYRPDQQSYILYPNKELPRFLEKNTIPKEKVAQSKLLGQLLQDHNFQIINQDIKGGYHFNGNFHNANDLKVALTLLEKNQEYKELVTQESEMILQIFEGVFNHKSFTGRSGTFYAFEGLGSIYWHMVSKLHLATQEVCLKSINDNDQKEVVSALISHYEEIGKGIGIHKSPSVYGAFPTDPYSHTPMHRGAQQPGMTGQVKEDILTRIGELGVMMNEGKLEFHPTLLHKNEFLIEGNEVNFVTVDGTDKTIQLEKGSLAFSVCQVPVIYAIASSNKMEIHYKNEVIKTFDSLELEADESQKIFGRKGEISVIKIHLTEDKLR
jgi:hypothetical protein